MITNLFNTGIFINKLRIFYAFNIITIESDLVAELQVGQYWLENGKVLSRLYFIPTQVKVRKSEAYHSKLFS